MRHRPVVLLTGFGPFPGVPVNVSGHLVPELAVIAARAFPAFRFEPHVLATEWMTAPVRARALYHELKPAAAIHFGVSSRARGFEVETRGVNRVGANADACGDTAAAPCLSPDGPPALQSRLPVTVIVERLRRRGIPAVLSRDAGSYLCNALLYHAVDHCRRSSDAAQAGMRSGFIHIPATVRIEGRRVQPGPPAAISWTDLLVGGLEIIAATVRAHPVPVPTVMAGPRW